MEKCCEYIEEFKETGNWDGDLTAYAAFNGHLDCLRYAHEKGCPWNIRTASFAADGGQLGCLKYVHENGCPWHRFTTSHAAENGHFDCLKYAYENGSPWNEFTILYAAKYGDLNSLKYAYENGCPWNEKYTLSNLDKHASKIDLDDKWWRTFLFDKDLTNYTSLQTLVNSKKEEIKQLQLSSEILFSYTSKDVIKYVLWPYF